MNFVFCFFSHADYAQFFAQVRGSSSHRAGGHRWATHFDLHLPGDSIHRSHGLPESRGKIITTFIWLDPLLTLLTKFWIAWQVTALKIKHNPFAKAFLDSKERSGGGGGGHGGQHGDSSDGGVHPHSMVHHQYSQCKFLLFVSIQQKKKKRKRGKNNNNNNNWELYSWIILPGSRSLFFNSCSSF